MALSDDKTHELILLNESEALQVYATADVYYNGALIEMDLATGLVSPLGTATGPSFFYGRCNKKKTVAASSSSKVSLDTRGPVIKNTSVTGVTADTDVGTLVYCTSDDSDDMTITHATGLIPVGRVYRHRSTTYCDVKLFTPSESWAQRFGGGKSYEIGTATGDTTLEENEQ